MSRKTLAVFSFTSCEGCQFEMLNCYESFKELLKYFDIKNFRLGQEENLPEPFDIALIEGSPEGAKHEKFLKEIRKKTNTIIAIGSCAHLGGIQSQRNHLPKKLINKERVKTIKDIIKVDFTIPGCPINHKELYECLMDVYWGKKFNLPELSVCFEFRQNENDCLIKNKKPCLGPITRMGCNSICPNSNEACLGCRGTITTPNIHKLKEILSNFTEESEIVDMLTFYGDYTKGNKT